MTIKRAKFARAVTLIEVMVAILILFSGGARSLRI